MPIFAVEGDLLDFAIRNSNAIAPWMYGGVNSRWRIWSDLINRHNVELEIVHLMDPENFVNNIDLTSPWKLGNPTVLKITNKPEWALKFIYIFPNEFDNPWLDNLGELNVEVIRCITILQQLRIKSVSLIQIPAFSNNEESNLLSANRLVDVIYDWKFRNNDEMNFYLVDRKNRFQALLKE